MLLYMSSQKFGNDTKILKEWIEKNDNKIAIIPNALDAKGEEKIQKNLKEDIELQFIYNIYQFRSFLF